MEIIQINCNECNFDGHPDATSIDFNYDDIKNIIESNYITYIYYCDHKKNELVNIITNTAKLYFHFPQNLKYGYATNGNYPKIYNKFIVREDKETLKILLDNEVGYKHIKGVKFEEFMSTIKKGTLIDCYNSTIQKLEKVLLEHNPDFILEKILSDTYVINTIPNYTKPAIKQI